MKKFLTVTCPKIKPLGIDPKLFTSEQIRKFFKKNNKVKEIEFNLVDNIFNKSISNFKPFFSLEKKSSWSKIIITRLTKFTIFLKKDKSDYIFISSPENVAWLLNIRGFDNPFSPIPNCRLFINQKKKNFFLVCEAKKAINLIKQNRVKKKQLIEPTKFKNFIDIQKKGKNYFR